jgi:hypothetical protein
MSCAASAARPRAGLRAFILSLPLPRRLARRVGDGSTHAARALLLVWVLALLALQVEVHAHALSHLSESTHAATKALADGASPDEEEERHADVVCLECLALAALDLPPAALKSLTFDDHGATSPPAAAPQAAAAWRPLRPRCRAPPPSALRHLPR